MASDDRTPLIEVLEVPILFGRTAPITTVKIDVKPPYALHTVQDACLRFAAPIKTATVFHNGLQTALTVEADARSVNIVCAATSTVLSCGQHIVVELEDGFDGRLPDLITVEGTIRTEHKMNKPVTKADFQELTLREQGTMQDGRAKGQVVLTCVGNAQHSATAAEGIAFAEKHAEKSVIVDTIVEPMNMYGGEQSADGRVTCSMMVSRIGNALFGFSLKHVDGIVDVWLRASGTQLGRFTLAPDESVWKCAPFNHTCPVMTGLLSGAVYIDVTFAAEPTTDCVSTIITFSSLTLSEAGLRRIKNANLVALPVKLDFLGPPEDDGLNAHQLVVIYMRGLCAFRRLPPRIAL